MNWYKNDDNVKLQYTSVGGNEKRCEDEDTLTLQYDNMRGYTDIKQSNLSDAENAVIAIANHVDSIRRKL